MPIVVIEQPDGKLAVYSMVSGRIEVWDATDEDVVEYARKEVALTAEEAVRTRIEGARTMRAKDVFWTEFVAQDARHGGGVGKRWDERPRGDGATS